MKKNFILDTNVLMSDPNAILSFEENTIILPLTVLEELDNNKDRQDLAGKNARETSRKLSTLTKGNRNIKSGISINSHGGILKILSIDNFSHQHQVAIPSELNDKSGDNKILAVALAFKQANPDEETILVSRDVLLRLKGDVLGIHTEDYKNISSYGIKSDIDSYTGVISIEIDSLNDFYAGNLFFNKDFIEHHNIFPNQFLILKSGSGSGLGRFISLEKPIKKVDEKLGAWGIKPLNKEQAFALDLLYDDNVKLVSLSGKSGTGKTVLALAWALDQIVTHKKYKKLIITRVIHPIGKDIGYLPGNLQEKLGPWLANYKDNLEFLLNEDVDLAKDKGALPSKKKGDFKPSFMLEEYFERGIIEMEATALLRGRSLPNCIFIIDETQNSTLHEIKSVITRAGNDSKFLVLGDVEQIDNLYVDGCSNGLSVVVDKFKDQSIAGHVSLIKGQRSELATIASNIL